jgi:hypothetical protein
MGSSPQSQKKGLWHRHKAMTTSSAVVNKPKHSSSGISNQEEMEAYELNKGSIILKLSTIDMLRELHLAIPSSSIRGIDTFDELVRSLVRVYCQRHHLPEVFWNQP